MRRGGQILASVMKRLESSLRPGITTGELDRVAEEAITEAGAHPSALGYKGFPRAICVAPNNVIVHGIPDEASLKDGDIVTLDVALLHEGFHVDNARTYPVGEVDPEVQRLLDVTKEALEAAIAQCEPGKRIGDVGYTVEHIVES